MIKNLTQSLSEWNFMRWLRLGLGGFILVQAFLHHDSISGIFGAFFIFQALTNTGCCGSGGCAVPESKSKSEKDITFEEVKSR